MADYTLHQFAIAADAEDIVKALYSIAENLDKHTEADYPNTVQHSMEPSSAFNEVADGVISRYWMIFPWVTGKDRKKHEPHIRPYGKTAEARLFRAGGHYVLVVRFGTAWGDHDDDVIRLVKGFPSGRYGVSYLSACEVDNFNDTGFSFCTIDETGKMGRSRETGFDPLPKVTEIAERYWKEDIAAESNLGKVAFAFSSFYWPEWDWNNRSTPKLSGHELWNPRLGLWRDPSKGSDGRRRQEVDEEKLIGQALEMLERFPLTLGISSAAEKSPFAAGEKLIAGMSVELNGEWWGGSSDDELNSKFCLLNQDGNVVGSLDRVLSDGKWTNVRGWETVSLALLTPYLTAVVDSAIPRSIRVKTGASSAVNISACIGIKPVDIEELEAFLRKRLGEFSPDFATSTIKPETIEMLPQEMDLLSGSAYEKRKARASLAARSVRNATVEELECIWRSSELPETVSQESSARDLLPINVASVDLIEGNEVEKAIASRIYFPRKEKVGDTGETVSKASFFYGKDATIVAVSQYGKKAFVQGEVRTMRPLRAETLLYGLWRAGVITDADLQNSGDWRLRFADILAEID